MPASTGILKPSSMWYHLGKVTGSRLRHLVSITMILFGWSRAVVLDNGYEWLVSNNRECQSPSALLGDLVPPSIDGLTVNTHGRVTMAIAVTAVTSSSLSNPVTWRTGNASYAVTVTSGDPRVAVTFGYSFSSSADGSASLPPLSAASSGCDRNLTASFTVRGVRVGRCVLEIVVTCCGSHGGEAGIGGEISSSAGLVLCRILYPVSIIRRLRGVDVVFNWAMAVTCMLNSFSLGCATDYRILRQQLKHPTGLLITAFCQFILLPPVSVAIATGCGLSPLLAAGLLYVASVPGGGLGYVATSVINGQRALSAATNCASILLSLAICPLWIFILDRLIFDSVAADRSSIHLGLIVAWLTLNAAAYAAGLALRWCTANSADAFLNWFTVPFLLLYCLLFTTIGVYINNYAFDLLDTRAMLAAISVPAVGYLTASVACVVCRQEGECARTVAAEGAMFNCMLVLVAVRFSFDQPDADLVSAVPMWVTFTSPIPIIVAGLFASGRRKFLRRYGRRREYIKRRFSIASSILNITPMTQTTTLSAQEQEPCGTPSDEPEPVITDDQTVSLL